MVAYDMSDLRTVRHIFQGPKSDWSVMILTFALTVIFDLTVAVYTGVMLASLLFMRRMSELTGIHTCVSGEEEEAAAHDIPLPDEETVPDGVEIFAINGPLFFGVADPVPVHAGRDGDASQGIHHVPAQYARHRYDRYPRAGGVP